MNLKINVFLLFLGITFNHMKAQNFPLSIFNPSNIPTGATFEWHNDIPISSTNKIDNINVGIGLYYGVFKNIATDSCYSSYSMLKITRNSCVSPFVNLNSMIDTTSKPSDSFLSFHTANPVSLNNKITSTTTENAPSGIYYICYYSPLNQCFSEPSVIVVLNIYNELPNCCPRTPIYLPMSSHRS